MALFYKNNKFIYPIIIVILFVGFFAGGFFIGKNNVELKVCQPETIDFSLFWDAYNKLSANFINPEKINNQEIIYGAIRGMAGSLQDPYTSFFDPEQSKQFNDSLSGFFSGIGAEVGIKKNQLTIIAPLEGTPAQKAGIMAGDMILKINDKETTDMTTDEAVKLIRGQRGTEVTLNIYRSSWTRSKDIKIIRDTIKVPSVKWALKDNNIAYIQIFQFDQILSPDFKKSALEIINSPAEKIVLDLRNNPGGYLELSQEIAGWFLERGKVVTIEDFGKAKEQTIYKTQGSANFVNYPMVILINGGSASASEILAGTLRDNRDIKLIGEKSFGKGSVQQILNLKDGSSLKITIAKWLTPKGASISEVGLTPDYKVEITEKDVEAGKDPQLEKALEIIKTIK
jgi:carboxyl-terminal processing protease